MRRILMIEDDAQFAQILKSTLGVKDVRLAASMAQAIQEIAAETPDVILLDLGLADSDSMQTLERISELKLITKGALVVVITGNPTLRGRAIARGADDFIDKADAGFFAKVSGYFSNYDPRACFQQPLIEKIEHVVDELAGLQPSPPKVPAPPPKPFLRMLGMFIFL